MRVYFNGTPHLSFRLSEFVMVQSWKYAAGRFYIEYYFKRTSPILCEYDTEEKWASVLKLVDEHLAFYQSLPN